ncbi:MAG: pyrroline-5-carboxylate reductase [Clostridiaceae bacterium]|jgi:pyrroline-5-carboxylate reductase|nr:pyrroline-5-carboxylate reductase [Clostridiaceae bacterium]
MVLAVIGTGNMGRALTEGMVRTQTLDPLQIRLFDADSAKAKALALSLGASACLSLEDAVSGADVLLIAVKPPVVPDVLGHIRPLLARQLVVSIAAGVTLASLRALAGPEVALARVMPNTPALVGAGVSAVCFDQASDEQQTLVRSLLLACGRVYDVPESALDAVTGLSGSGPAYIMLVIEALADGGVRNGLARDMALEMAAMTVYGAASLVLETKTHPAVLKDQVCSPGGTTIAAVASLEADGLRSALIRAVDAATRRAAELRQKAGPDA